MAAASPEVAVFREVEDRVQPARPRQRVSGRRPAALRPASLRARRPAARRSARSARRACPAPRRPAPRRGAAAVRRRLDQLGGDAAGPQQPQPLALDLDDRRFQADRRRPAVDDQRHPVAEVGRDGCGRGGADAARRVGARRRQRPAEPRDERLPPKPCGMRSAMVSSPAVTSGWTPRQRRQRQHQRQRPRPECLRQLSRQPVENARSARPCRCRRHGRSAD